MALSAEQEAMYDASAQLWVRMGLYPPLRCTRSTQRTRAWAWVSLLSALSSDAAAVAVRSLIVRERGFVRACMRLVRDFTAQA